MCFSNLNEEFPAVSSLYEYQERDHGQTKWVASFVES